MSISEKIALAFMVTFFAFVVAILICTDIIKRRHERAMHRETIESVKYVANKWNGILPRNMSQHQLVELLEKTRERSS